MLIDLISGNAYLSVNKKLINILGINNSIYLAYILDEYHKNNNEELKLSRKNTEDLLTLDIIAQRDCEVQLGNSNIIECNDTGSDEIILKLNPSGVTGLICSEDPEVINKVRKSARVDGKVTKGVSERQKYKNSLKYSITAPNEELLKAYQDWVDGVYANPSGFLSKRAIESFKKDIDAFAKGDLDLALKIIDIAAIRGYKYAEYAINVYKADLAKNLGGRITSNQAKATLSNEVF